MKKTAKQCCSIRSLGLLLGLLLAIGTGPSLSGETYTVAIVPQSSAAKIEEKWRPLLNHLESELGITLKLIHYPNIPDFEQGVVDGVPDIAYMNPYHAVRAHELQGYNPLVRDNVKLLYGQLWVRADSDIQHLDQLEESTIVFPAPNAFGASLYMRALLRNKEGIQFQTKYVKTHSNVYRHVAMNRASAGGGVARTYKAESGSLQQKLRLIYQTPGVRPHPLCAHSRVPADLQEQITAAIVDLKTTSEQTRAMMKKLAMPEPGRSDFEQDYAPLKELGLSDFVEGAMK